MFRTIHTLKKYTAVNGSCIYTALFDTEAEADAALQKVLDTTYKDRSQTQTWTNKHPDGSYIKHTLLENAYFTIDNDQWVRDLNDGKVRIMPVGTCFANQAELTAYIKKTQDNIS